MNLDEKAQAEVRAITRTVRIVVFALCTGLAVFGGYVVFLHDVQRQPGFLTYMSLGFAVLEGCLAMVVPRFMVTRGRRAIAEGKWTPPGEGSVPAVVTDAGKLGAVFQTSTIIGCALLEGAGFFGIVAYMLEGDYPALIAAAVMLIGVAAHMPLGDRLSTWVKDQLKLIEDEKRFSQAAKL